MQVKRQRFETFLQGLSRVVESGQETDSWSPYLILDSWSPNSTYLHLDFYLITNQYKRLRRVVKPGQEIDSWSPNSTYLHLDFYFDLSTNKYKRRVVEAGQEIEWLYCSAECWWSSSACIKMMVMRNFIIIIIVFDCIDMELSQRG